MQRYASSYVLTQFASRASKGMMVEGEIEFLTYFIIFEVVEAAPSFIKQPFDDERVMALCF